MEPLQQHGQQPLGLQNADPSIDANEEGRPEGQDHHHQQRRADLGRGARHGQRHGIADQKQQQRRDRRDPQRGEIGFDIERVFGEIEVILEIKLRQEIAELREAFEHRRIGRHGDVAVGQRNLQDDEEWREKEQRQPEIGNGDHQPAAGAAVGNGARLHDALPYRVSTRPASADQDSQTLSSKVMGRSTWRETLAWAARSTRPSVVSTMKTEKSPR